jgi:hypothetical protein
VRIAIRAALRDASGSSRPGQVEGATDLTTGAHALVVLFYENSGGARMELWWAPWLVRSQSNVV